MTNHYNNAKLLLRDRIGPVFRLDSTTSCHYIIIDFLLEHKLKSSQSLKHVLLTDLYLTCVKECKSLCFRSKPKNGAVTTIVTLNFLLYFLIVNTQTIEKVHKVNDFRCL